MKIGGWTGWRDQKSCFAEEKGGQNLQGLHFGGQQPAGQCRPEQAASGKVTEQIRRNGNYSVGNWKLDKNVREMMQLGNSGSCLWKKTLIINTSPHIQGRLQEEVRLS